MGKIGIDFKTGNLKTTNAHIVGIDLGTTNSLIAYIDQGTAHIIPIGVNDSGIFPSILHFLNNGEIIYGEYAKQKMILQPERTFYSIKRLMGKTMGEINNKNHRSPYVLASKQSEELVKFKIDDHIYSAAELSSFILKEIKTQAEAYLQTEIHQAVITVPAYFTDSQRQATRDAGRLAGLDVLRIINEPTAASMAYGIGLKPDEIKQVMVYDFGGGTFDVSILRIENGIFEVLATQGDNFLGGDDLDIAIMDYWKSAYNLEISNENYNEIRLLAEQAKKELGINESVSYLFKSIHLSLDRTIFNSIAAKFIDRTISSCHQALKDSSLTIQDINEVILVGGSSRLNLVKEKIKSAFHRPINDFLNPDEVVALGAAIQADILAGNRSDLLLLDIAPLSLGIETLGGLMDTIIPRNSKIPLQLAKNYTTSIDGQKNLKISVYQGERELIEDNIKLAEFTLNNLPSMAAGLPKIEVKFSIDADGILSITAKEHRSGIQQSIEVRSAYKLDEQELAKRLKDSTTFAEIDIKKKALIELQNEANYILNNANKFIKQNTEFLEKDEIKLMESAMDRIVNCVKTEEIQKITDAITAFNQSTSYIAHRIMDIQLKRSLGGNSIDNI